MNLKRIFDSNRDQDWAFLMIRYQMPEFIKAIQDQLTAEDLYVDENDKINGFGLEKECHVTLFPCLSNDTPVNKIIPYLPKVDTLAVKLINVSMFENDKYNVLKADVEVKSCLHSLNELLGEHFTSGSEFKEYHPHMTIAYVKKDSPLARTFCQEFEESVEVLPETYDFSFVADDKYQHCYFNV
jgi:hypothetical protein